MLALEIFSSLPRVALPHHPSTARFSTAHQHSFSRKGREEGYLQGPAVTVLSCEMEIQT